MKYIEDDLDESVTSGDFQKFTPSKKSKKIVFLSGNNTYNNIKKIINKRKKKAMNENMIEVDNYTNKAYIGGSIGEIKITASSSSRNFRYKIEAITAGDEFPGHELVLSEGYHSFSIAPSIETIAKEIVEFEDSETEMALFELNNEIYRMLLEHSCIKEDKEEELYESLYEEKATVLDFEDFRKWLEKHGDCFTFPQDVKMFLNGIEVHIVLIENSIKKLLHDALKIVVL